VTDWRSWHDGYADPGSDLSRRLAVVQGLIRSWLDDARAGELRLLSACAGQAHDVIGALSDHPRRGDVRGLLVEQHAANAEAARAGLRRAQLHDIDVLTGDAGSTTPYVSLVPADLVLVCGVFGNVAEGDVRGTVEALPALLAQQGSVIWTRHRREPDLTPKIRSWFADAGFEELAFVSPGPGRFSVGTHRLAAPPASYEPDRPLFAFVDRPGRGEE
jgi:hypothetical protein